MGIGVSTLSPRYRVAHFLQEYLVPLGWLVILTSMFIAGDRGRVHQLFYVFLALPTFILIALRPALLKVLVNNPLFKAFVVFSVYTIISVGWSSTDDSALSLSRRPLYLALLFFCAGIVAMWSTERLNGLTRIAAIVAAVAGVASLIYYVVVRLPLGADRLEGYGALYNPLLSAHVFGAFATYWLADWLNGRKLASPLAVACLAALLITLFATGSRTPLVGLALALAWLLATGNPRRGAAVGAVVIGVLLVLLALHPEILTQRGASFRPQIWQESLRQIGLRPLLGYGYDADMVVDIPGADHVLADPHNIELGVLYSGGAVGLLLWCALYFIALSYGWRHRKEADVNLATAWLIFGIGSGLTEGMAFMSRPKEHWFLIWIPLALMYGHWIARTVRPARDKDDQQ